MPSWADDPRGNSPQQLSPDPGGVPEGTGGWVSRKMLEALFPYGLDQMFSGQRPEMGDVRRRMMQDLPYAGMGMGGPMAARINLLGRYPQQRQLWAQKSKAHELTGPFIGDEDEAQVLYNQLKALPRLSPELDKKVQERIGDFMDIFGFGG